MITISVSTIVVALVFIYFTIGAFYSAGYTIFTIAFGGKFDTLAISIFFFWPVHLLFGSNGGGIVIIFGLFAAVVIGITTGVWFLLH